MDQGASPEGLQIIYTTHTCIATVCELCVRNFATLPVCFSEYHANEFCIALYNEKQCQKLWKSSWILDYFWLYKAGKFHILQLLRIVMVSYSINFEYYSILNIYLKSRTEETYYIDQKNFVIE